MDRSVAVLAEPLEVVVRERDARVIDVVRVEVDDVVYNLGGLELALLVASLTHHRRDQAERRVERALHVVVAVATPRGRMIEGYRPLLGHICSVPRRAKKKRRPDLLQHVATWVRSLRRSRW